MSKNKIIQNSLRASSPFGGYREKYTREKHARGDATSGPLGLRRSLAKNGEPARRLHAKRQTNLLGDKATPIPLAVGLTSDGKGRILFFAVNVPFIESRNECLLLGEL